MKKTNKYRNNGNNNNTIYSLNYKFDSTSIAGKVNGTALELIKRYNDLAKDAHSNSDYVNAEIFRQYAEHYRKIVTDINERKNIRAAEFNENKAQTEAKASEENVSSENLSENQVEAPKEEVIKEEKEAFKTRGKKSFKVIEISEAKSKETKSPKKESAEECSQTSASEESPASKRPFRRKTAVV